MQNMAENTDIERMLQIYEATGGRAPGGDDQLQVRATLQEWDPLAATWHSDAGHCQVSWT